MYWFPSMERHEIIEAFNEWTIPVSFRDLEHPTSDFVTMIYSACLQRVRSLSEADLEKPLQAALAQVENPDLYSVALGHTVLFYHLQRLARAAQINDFSFKDLSSPDPERTRGHLSAFINFVKFSEQRADFITGLREKSGKVNEELQKVLQALRVTEKEVAGIKASLAEDEPRCELLRRQKEELKESLLKSRDLQAEYVETVKMLKAERASLIQRRETLQTSLDSMSELIARTRARIVESPERITSNIRTMSSTLAQDKQTVASNEAKIRDLQLRSTALIAIEKDVRVCIEQLQVIEKEIALLDVSKKTLADLKDALDEKSSELKELELRHERVTIQQANATEKLERAQRHAEDRRLASQQQIERLKTEYQEMANERRENDRQVEELRAEADELERLMNDHKRQSQAELNELLKEYWKLRHATEVYMETLANKLGMQVTST
ncbi:Nuf2 family-domain-containing protein [Irpex rosettiformis]|uniref:Nuf2 family-domain-containing protein n=1 Tax=Irpex rosettiformis TaxID=378272 RepID=A0ACB8TTU3_9APHY|nr:Nuf2 family-domain-containing protein [Irpex rosettiformis]